MRMNEIPPMRDVPMRDEEEKKDDSARPNNGFGGQMRINS